MSTLRLLCAGAAQGLVEALEPRWAAETGGHLAVRFGPVGLLRETLLGGAPCDVFVATQAVVEGLVGQRLLDGATCVALGRVATGIAVRDADEAPRIDDEATLRAALAAADRVYMPDPQRATAGIHLAAVIERLGLREHLAERLSVHPAGAAAMQALAESADARPLGCTQVTEILHTSGVRLVGPLPPGFDLATTYTAAVTLQASDRRAASDFVERLAGAATAELRRACGFDAHA